MTIRKFKKGDLCLHMGEVREVAAVGTSINKQPLCLIGGRWVLERELEPAPPPCPV